MRRLLLLAALLVLIAAAALGVEFSGGPSGSGIKAVADHPYRFVPVAASFVSRRVGFELGYDNCHYCSVLRVTHDGGTTWRLLPAQHPYVPLETRARRSVSGLAFALPSGGWLYGPGLWDSDDGGRVFGLEVPTPVLTVQVGSGFAYALTGAGAEGRAALWRTPVGNELWRRLSIPALGRGEIGLAVSGNSLMLLEDGYVGPGIGLPGKLWLGSDHGTRWHSRPVPCDHRGGAALVASVAARRGAWLLDCFSNDQSSQEQHTSHHLFLTRDDGRTWRLLATPTRQGNPVVLGGAGDHFFLGTESGGTDALVGSFDGGRHWRVLLSHAGFLGWSGLHFVDARTGFVAGPTRGGPSYGSRNHVYRTDDGGRTWRTIS